MKIATYRRRWVRQRLILATGGVPNLIQLATGRANEPWNVVSLVPPTFSLAPTPTQAGNHIGNTSFDRRHWYLGFEHCFRQQFLVYLSQQPGETISAESLVSSAQSFPMRDRTIEAALSSPRAAKVFATATSPNRLCLFSAATIARRRSAFVEE